MKWATQRHHPCYSAALQLVGVVTTTMFYVMTYTCHKLFSRALSPSTLAITDILLIHLYIHVWRLFSPTASTCLTTFILPNFSIHRDIFFIQPKTLQWLLKCCAESPYIYTWPSNCYSDFASNVAPARERAIYCHLLGAWPYGHALSDSFGQGCLCL